MPGVNKKEQLGARLTPGVRQRVVDAAAAAGVSLNEWVEVTLVAALDGTPAAPVMLEGQTTIADALEQPTVSPKRFEPTCSMRTYHWKCSPGSPCRRCGGETE